MELEIVQVHEKRPPYLSYVEKLEVGQTKQFVYEIRKTLAPQISGIHAKEYPKRVYKTQTLKSDSGNLWLVTRLEDKE